MSNAIKEKLIEELEFLNDEKLEEVYEIVHKLKEEKVQEDYVCPYCGKKEHTFNKEMEQSLRDSLNGKGLISFDSSEEMFKYLHEEAEKE